MKKTILYLSVATGLFAGSFVRAAEINAELVMPGNKSWKGSLVGRDGGWIEFRPANAAAPIRLGASTVKELRFEVAIDPDKIGELLADRQFERIIESLDKALKPFATYSDIPSNLTRYNLLMMELYYRTKQYDKSLEISSKIVDDDRDPVLQTKSRVYQALALIDSGKAAEAAKLLEKYGWNQDLSEDAPPEMLYIRAKLLVLTEDYGKAMETIAKVIAFNSQNPEWMQPSELLCAEIYTELGMYDSAEEVCREIATLYKDTPESDKAEQLKIKIEKLRAERNLDKTVESEEA